MLEKNVWIGSLLDIYGALLPEKQRILIDLTCNEDLSLSEISEMEGITRQGVHDSIRRGEQSLLSYEEKLHILGQKKERAKMLGVLQQELKEVYALLDDGDAKVKLGAACELVIRLLQKEE